MKSRTSFFDKTVFRKNLTRFAPAWALYALCLVLGLILMLDDGTSWLPGDLVDCVQIMSVITPCYALLVAQLLFGDLYNSRMCNALHALPLRRENWFVTNVASGLAFHLIPTAIMAVLAQLFLTTGCDVSAWAAALCWMLGVNLQYLCFFGIGVFSAFCVGSRFAMAVVYGILNFGSVILGWIVSTLYIPQLYGLKLDMDPFLWFSPVGQMVESSFMYVTRNEGPYFYTFYQDENFGYYFLCAAVGVALMALALQLYRKRRLECAGDFMAVRHLEPVFLVAYTLVAGSAFQLIFCEIFGMDSLVFLFIGMAVGWFTGQMLVHRSIRVFRGRTFLGCIAVMAAFGLTLLITAWDIFGVESWIPKAAEVESVTVSDGHYSYHSAQLTMDTPEEIEAVLALHQQALDGELGSSNVIAVDAIVPTSDAETETVTYEDYCYSIQVTLEYHLTDGRTVCRYYTCWSDTAPGRTLRAWFSSAEAILGTDDLGILLDTYDYGVFTPYSGKQLAIDSEELPGLLEAILADSEAGVMGQSWDYHSAYNIVGWLYLEDRQISVFEDSVNTVAWLEENGVDVQAILGEWYGY